MSNIPSELQKADWNKIAPEVLRRAYGLVGKRPDVQHLVPDLVQQAIVKTLTGKRKYNPAIGSLSDHLIGVVQSDLSHWYRSPRRRVMAEMDDRVVEIADYQTPTPEELEIKRQADQAFFEFVDARNAKAGMIARCMLREGMIKSSELSNDLGISQQVARRLKRNLEALAKDYHAEKGDDEILAVFGGYSDER